MNFVRSIRPAVCGLALALLATVGCESWVNDFTGPTDSISDEQLDSEAGIRLATRGVELRFHTSQNSLMMMVSVLSDDLRFARLEWPWADLQQHDAGEIAISSGMSQFVFGRLAALRFLADDLVDRTERIAANGTLADAGVRDRALFTGYLYGGIARYLFATYYGLNPREGGGVLDGGPFIPSEQMYDLARDRLEAALHAVPDDGYESRLTHSLLARLHLYAGNQASAAEHAALGMRMGDSAFASVNNDFASWYFSYYTSLFPYTAVGDRVVAYVEAEPAEAARLPILPFQASATSFFIQDKYVEIDDPIPFMTWQETSLMRAEFALQDGRTGDALGHMNAVRASHGLSPLASATLEALLAERDKELFLTGARLVDQRRFDRWHLGPGTWQYLPIPQNERASNANL